MFYKCTNAVKISIYHNKKGFVINNNNNNMEMCKIFLKLKILKYIKIEKNSIIAFINYLNNKPIFKNIENLFKPGHKKIIKLKDIININKKHNWIILISTNKGILNNFEAERLKQGGLIIAKIWN